MPAKKTTKTRSAASLKREIAALRSTLDDVWAALVDVDEATPPEEALNAIDKACEIMVADWPDEYTFTDELSPKVQEQIALEEELNRLADEAERTEDLDEKFTILRKALALQLGTDEQNIKQQIEQLPPEEYSQLVSLLFVGLILSFTAKIPIQLRKEIDRLITELRGFKKALPRKHGPDVSPIIAEALKMRDNEGKPYKDIMQQLAQKYGEQVMSKYLTPKVLGERVRSRRSRLRRAKKASSQQPT